MEANVTFKSYSSRSKAKRALRDTYHMETETGMEAMLTMVDEKHGFYVKDGVPYIPQTDVSETLGTAAQEVITAAQKPDEPATDEQPADEPATPSSLGSFALSQLTASSNTVQVEAQRPAQRSNGLKIERNREERNGVKMPSAGGMCRAVWDALSNLMTHDEASGLANVPTVADIKKLAEEKGWNVNNASIEYYQWRKFHGITGRGKKQI